MKRFSNMAVALGLVCGMAGSLGSWDARAEDTPGDAVIQPGQEGLVSDLLENGNQRYPGDCMLGDVSIEKNAVKASFTCAGKQVPVELRYPGAVPKADGRTERFAIIAPDAPRPFVDALQKRLAGGEAAFHWTILKDRRSAATTTARKPRLVIAIAIGALALVMVAGVLVIRRRR